MIIIIVIIIIVINIIINIIIDTIMKQKETREASMLVSTSK